jgi:hypothetical protein
MTTHILFPNKTGNHMTETPMPDEGFQWQREESAGTPKEFRTMGEWENIFLANLKRRKKRKVEEAK